MQFYYKLNTLHYLEQTFFKKVGICPIKKAKVHINYTNADKLEENPI